MSTAKSKDDLLSFDPFSKLSEKCKQALADGLRYAHFSTDSIAINKGEAVSGAYFVTSGQLRVYTLTPKGNEATLYQIAPGETCVLAMNCMFNNFLYPAWVEAKPSTTVALIHGDLYRELFNSEPLIRNLTVQTFSTLAFRLIEELEEIHTCNLEQRVANFLLTHASSEKIIEMTQQEIASHLGTTREVISRILNHLVSEGHIKTSRNLIRITRTEALSGLLLKR